jgi:hypothetical protein
MPARLVRMACLRMVCLVAAAVVPGLIGSQALGQSPLSSEINRLIAAKSEIPPAPRASDEEFHRRIFLDLAGRIPSVDETRAFLADDAADKRERLIDRLLASDDHVRRIQQMLHVMLMERLGDHEEWQKFLQTSLAANKPWDRLAGELLHPNADDEAIRGAAFWYTKRLENYGQNPVDMPALVRDVGRLFLGIDVQCAQCHDHLFVDDYKQEDYYGLLAFVGQATIRTDVKFPAVALKPLDKKVEFMSVFVKEARSVGPKLPGLEEVAIPTLAEEEKFAQPPDRSTNFPGVARFNTLEILSQQLPQRENKHFARNMANRLWWMLLGRGLVQPLDLHHSDNPASHPELLDLLSNEFAAHEFDLRWLLREIARSETYQRSSRCDDEAALAAAEQLYRVGLEKPLSSEQMLASIRQALSSDKPLTIAAAEKPWSDWQARFDKALANPPREPEIEHAPTVKGALFLLNDSEILKWLQPDGDNLTARLLRADDADALAEELYLAILSRHPTAEERGDVSQHLAARSDNRARAIVQLAWALLASNEFCLNH